MDRFFTKVKIHKSDWQLTHEDKILLMGSCFTSEIGQKFELHGFNVMKNPFGVIYNPLSMVNLIVKALKRDYFTTDDVIKSGEYYYLFAAHGDIRGNTVEECLTFANDTLNKVCEFLKQSSTIILTLGTAWSYWYNEGNVLMANCHKIPQKYITRRLLSVTEITDAICDTVRLLQQIRPNVRHCLLTVSPVRHINEGLYDNKLSKSTLHLAADDALKRNVCVDYFPAYEIVTDELRDYRFYARDLVHINDSAVDYIWERFSEEYFSDETKALNEKYYKLFQMKNHRPFNPQSEGYQKHLDKIKQLERELSSKDGNM